MTIIWVLQSGIETQRGKVSFEATTTRMRWMRRWRCRRERELVFEGMLHSNKNKNNIIIIITPSSDLINQPTISTWSSMRSQQLPLIGFPLKYEYYCSSR
jgi:hypothetical protein